jgi:CBS-domain-containing membrane protein
LPKLGTGLRLEDQDLEDAQILMEQKQIRRLPVMNHDSELVGVMTVIPSIVLPIRRPQ